MSSGKKTIDSEALQIACQEGLEPLRDIHKRSYPIPKQELGAIVGGVSRALSSVAEQIRDRVQTLPPEEQEHASGFIFYHDTLRRAGMSPISVRVHYEFDEVEKRTVLRHKYASDIVFRSMDSGWHMPGLSQKCGIVPRLGPNNLRQIFIRDCGRLEWPIETFREQVGENAIDEYVDELERKFTEGTLLHGDLRFGSSRLKRWKAEIEREVGHGRAGPPEEEIEKANVELADRRHLRYINLDGGEVCLRHTSFESWVEFQNKNPALFKSFVNVCNIVDASIRKKDDVLPPELHAMERRLTSRTFTLLRVQGFCTYPEITA